MKRLKRGLLLILIILAGLAVLGISNRIIAYRKLKQTTHNDNISTVSVIKANPGPATEEVVLPGDVQAWHSSTIFARTNGYTINWLVDIGAHVYKDQLLATISTPEVDAQLRQTEANLKTAEANNKIAQITAQRWRNLLKTASVSLQDTEEKISAAEATQTIVNSTRANRDQLRELVSYERVIAPFTGIIMSRTVDIGNLINAGASTVPLFQIVQIDPLRIYVRVPEYYSARIKPGLVANLYFREHPGKVYQAKLLNNAEAIDAATRTLLVQFEASNPKNELLAGSYAEVHIQFPSSPTSIYLPVNTLIFRAQGMQVATLASDNKVALKSIMIARDFGDRVQIASGLSAGENVILNPPSTLIDGQKVRIAAEGKK